MECFVAQAISRSSGFSRLFASVDATPSPSATVTVARTHAKRRSIPRALALKHAGLATYDGSNSRGMATRLYCSAAETGVSSASPAAESAAQESFITVTDAGLEQLRRVISTTPAASVLRVGVRSGGCSGMSFVMDFDSAENVTPDDTVVSLLDGEVRIACDPKSLLYLFGMQLDYSPALIGGGFKFLQPNAESTCGCGQSFAM